MYKRQEEKRSELEQRSECPRSKGRHTHAASGSNASGGGVDLDLELLSEGVGWMGGGEMNQCISRTSSSTLTSAPILISGIVEPKHPDVDKSNYKEVGTSDPYFASVVTEEGACVRAMLQVRVLVVDDSDLNRKVIRRAVERLATGYVQNSVVFTIDECEDGVTACESMTRALATRCPYDLVLMDNIMVYMNGPEAAAKMRVGGYSGYIAGVTGNVLAKDVRHFIDKGADCVLPKPLNMERLRAVVGQVIERASV